MVDSVIGVNLAVERLTTPQSEGSSYISESLHILTAVFIVICIATSHLSSLKTGKPKMGE